MKMTYVTCFTFVSALVLACSNTVPEPAPWQSGINTTGKDVIAGFLQRPDTSRFVMGTRLFDMTEGQFDRVVGTLGVESIDRTNGHFMAVPNAGSPARVRPAFGHTGEEHNARALEYFIGAGLPADQVGRVTSQATMGGALIPGSDPIFHLVAYTTNVRRVIGGVDVDESFATVTINVDGDVVSEYVYWPNVQSHVADQAASVAAQSDGHVAIHHPPILTTPGPAFVTRNLDEHTLLDAFGNVIALPWDLR